jgi:histidine-containing phosphotransfer protein
LAQDESNPNFVSGLISLYFEDAAKKIQQLHGLLEQSDVNFQQVDACVHQFKGSSASFGAGEMTKICIMMRESCQDEDTPECLVQLRMMEGAFGRLHQTLDDYGRLERL